MTIPRYTHTDTNMEPDDAGQWVRAADAEAMLADWRASQHYSYIGADGKRVLARELEAEIKRLKKVEKALSDEIETAETENDLLERENARLTARAEDAEALLAAATGMISIVEGINNVMNHGVWRDERGIRLKDTPEWVSLYNAHAAMKEGR